LRQLGRRLGPPALIFLVAVAVADRVLGRGLAFLPRVAPDHAFADFQRGAAPLLANLLLLAAGLQATLLLPGLVLERRRRLESLLFGGLALGTLAMLGLVIWRRAAGGHTFLAAESLLLIAGWLLLILRLLLRRGPEPIPRIVAIAVYASLVLPTAWRLGLTWSGGRFEVGDPLDRLREAADLAALIALGTTAIPPIWRRDYLALSASAPFAVALVWLGFSRYGDLRQVVAYGTDLWLAALSPAVTVALCALGVLGVLSWPSSSWRHERGLGLSLAVFLSLAAGFMPIENETVLLAWTALLIAARSAAGDFETRDSLKELSG
jgi:hypothetical protein